MDTTNTSAATGLNEIQALTSERPLRNYSMCKFVKLTEPPTPEFLRSRFTYRYLWCTQPSDHCPEQQTHSHLCTSDKSMQMAGQMWQRAGVL